MFVDTDNGTAIEMHIYVTDPQDDLLNGMLEVDYQWGDDQNLLRLISMERWSWLKRVS